MSCPSHLFSLMAIRIVNDRSALTDLFEQNSCIRHDENFLGTLHTKGPFAHVIAAVERNETWI